MRLAILLVAFVLSIVSGMAQDTSLRQVRKAFDGAEVCNDCHIEGKSPRLTYVYKIPDDLTLSFNPKALLEVTFFQPGTLIPPITVHAGASLPQSGWFFWKLESSYLPTNHSIISHCPTTYLPAAFDPSHSSSAPTASEFELTNSHTSCNGRRAFRHCHSRPRCPDTPAPETCAVQTFPRRGVRFKRPWISAGE